MPFKEVFAVNDSITLHFRAQVPRHFDHIDNVYIAGNHNHLGNWSTEDGLTLIPTARGVFEGMIELKECEKLEFKAHLGDWDHVETDELGKNIDNREINCNEDRLIEIEILNFKIRPAVHPVPKTASAQILYFHEFYAEDFDNYRTVAIYLPPNYYKDNKRYPVLYALDGNNLFDEGTSAFGDEWRLDKVANDLINEGKIPPTIIVGIYNTRKRANEFLTGYDWWLGEAIQGQADSYSDFIIKKVKNFVDSNLRTLPDRKNTYLMGSSFGGFFTLYSLVRNSQNFSRFAAVSPAFFWSDHIIYEILKEDISPLPDRLWMDMGEREGIDDMVIQFKDGVEELKDAENILLSAGLNPDSNFRVHVAEGAIHSECSWSQRIDQILMYLLN